MTKYELKKVETSHGEIETLQYTDDRGTVSFVPIDELNSDYQRYLRWLKNPDADEFNDEDYA